jgi:Xaa-Pro aminopeptidase
MYQPIFAERRRRVLDALGGGVLVLPATPLFIRNNDVEHAYRQDSDLYYLTGLDEPESVLVLAAGKSPTATLFLRPRDLEREVWDGKRLGAEGAVTELGMDEAYPIAELDQKLPTLLSGHSRLFYHFGRDFDARLLRALEAARRLGRRGADYPVELFDSDLIVHEMRRIKGEIEIEHMQRAQAITEQAHRAAMAAAQPGMWEYEIEAILRARFRQLGAERVAYEPIVGSGPNATVLHHVKNDRQMENGDLLLIDAGCEYKYYAADVTRTFPVNGRFSPAQRDLYGVVLAAQERAITRVKSGNTLEAIHLETVRVLCEGLIALGIIPGPLALAIEEKQYQRYYMHRTSHYLGMDVHDVGRYYAAGEPKALEPGVVITIEPGLYIPEGDQSVPEHFRGMGIRIEDDVIVGTNGPINLSERIPKSVKDLEEACTGP